MARKKTEPKKKHSKLADEFAGKVSTLLKENLDITEDEIRQKLWDIVNEYIEKGLTLKGVEKAVDTCILKWHTVKGLHSVINTMGDVAIKRIETEQKHRK